MKPKGCAFATEDPELAEVLAAQVLQGLQRKRHNRALGVPDQVSLANYVRHHVKEKERAGRVEPNHMKHIRLHLAEAIQFFGEDAKIADIKTRDVSRWAAHLSKQPNGRGLRCPRCGRRGKPRGANAECRKCNKTWALPALSPGTIRHRLNSLSGMFRRALAEEKVQSNVVQAMLDKPTSNGRPEAPWLEIDDALLLEAARRDVPDPDAHTIECLHALVATHLLTGGRSAEVLGLCAEDISFDRKTVTFRPNTYRRLKTKTSHRTIPMQPQLEAILREHVFGSDPPITSGLLFRGRDGGLIRDWRKSLDRISVRCGWEPGAVRSKMFRHAYATHRLQCLDRGAPISPFIVANELGHGGESLVRRIYGHVGSVRCRGEHLEYRVEQHVETLESRLTALQGAVL